MMLKLDCDNVVMIDNHITIRCIFLNTSLSEKIKMSFLQNSLLQVEATEPRKSEARNERKTSSIICTDCHCEANIVDNWVYLQYIKL